MGKKKGLDFYRPVFIMLISLIFFGFFFANLTRDMWINPYVDHHTDRSWTFERSFSFNLTGGHTYRIYMMVDSPPDRPVYAEFRFAGKPELNFVFSLESDGKKNETFFEPFYLDENSTLNIWASSTFLMLEGMEQQIRIYKDLPNFLIHNELYMILFTGITFTIWYFTFMNYERVFIQIKAYGKKYLPSKDVESKRDF